MLEREQLLRVKSRLTLAASRYKASLPEMPRVRAIHTRICVRHTRVSARHTQTGFIHNQVRVIRTRVSVGAVPNPRRLTMLEQVKSRLKLAASRYKASLPVIDTELGGPPREQKILKRT